MIRRGAVVLGTMIIGTGDAIQAVGRTVEEAGWLLRKAGEMRLSAPAGANGTSAVNTMDQLVSDLRAEGLLG